MQPEFTKSKIYSNQNNHCAKSRSCNFSRHLPLRHPHHPLHPRHPPLPPLPPLLAAPPTKKQGITIASEQLWKNKVKPTDGIAHYIQTTGILNIN